VWHIHGTPEFVTRTPEPLFKGFLPSDIGSCRTESRSSEQIDAIRDPHKLVSANNQRAEWYEEKSSLMLIHRRDELDSCFRRFDWLVLNPIIICPRYGKTAHDVEPPVSVRATVVAFGTL
jgi:hypothetical protein